MEEEFANLTRKVEIEVSLQYKAREEFDRFLVNWIKVHGLDKEAYRGISYLMSAYVMMQVGIDGDNKAEPERDRERLNPEASKEDAIV